MSTNVDFYEQFATQYETAYAEVDTWETVRQWQLLLAKEKVPSARSLIDVGCGPGGHLKPWQHAGFSVSGLDASPAMLRLAATSSPGVPLYCADVLDTNSLGLLQNRYSVAVAHFNFLNLFPHDQLPTVLASLVAVLSDGGLCVTDFTFRVDEVGNLLHRCESLHGASEVHVTWKVGPSTLEERYWLHLPEHLRALALTSGFSRVKLYGWSPEVVSDPWCDVEATGRAVLVATKS